MLRAAQRRRGRPSARKDKAIQIRTSARTKAILVQAASLRGQKLSEFILDSARRRAEETMLDQRAFFLDSAAHGRFLAMLDSHPNSSRELLERMRRKPSWEG